jgi:hypothetical protein
MKINIVKFTVLTLLPAGLLALTSCSSTPEGQGTTVVAAEKGVPGGVMVETYQLNATVTGIDAATRKVTFVTPDGKKTTVKAGPDVVNFDQIHVGDQLKFTVSEELVVYLASGAPPADGAAGLVALAPKGAKPGVLMANTVQVTAKVTAIDLKHHKATLQLPDGTAKTVAVRPDVDLTQRKVGEEVVIRITEAFAILVEKP